MKVFTCINERGFFGNPQKYRNHLLVALQSLATNTSHEIILVVDGISLAGPLDNWLKEIGVLVVEHSLSFKEELASISRENRRVNFGVASGAFLRMDIPLIETDDEYALYVDSDVMVMSDFDLSGFKPETIAAAPEINPSDFRNLNSGVMLMNLPALRSLHPRLESSSGDLYDQGQINDFFRESIAHLPLEMNWKPYWGENATAQIIHWHGVKYPAARAQYLGLSNLVKWEKHERLYSRDVWGFEYWMRRYREILGGVPSQLLLNDFGPHGGSQVPVKFGFGPSNPAIVAGPSHVVRWTRNSVVGCTEEALPANQMIGYPGTPLWSKSFLERCLEESAKAQNLCLFVPDFRLGNEGVEDIRDRPIFLENPPVGISLNHICSPFDQEMRDRFLVALETWEELIGERLTLLFWSAFMRDVQNSLLGRHMLGGQYSNPNLSYSALRSSVKVANVVDLDGLFRFSNVELMRLIVDESSHPSEIGFRFLRAVLLESKPTVTAFLLAVRSVEQEILKVAIDAVKSVGGKILLTGDSQYLDTLIRYAGPVFLQRLGHAGLKVLPMRKVSVNETVVDSAGLQSETSHRNLPRIIFLVTDGQDVSAGQLEQLIRTKIYRSTPVIGLDWAQASQPVLKKRSDYRDIARGDGLVSVPAVNFTASESMLELGPLGIPTLTGLVAVLSELANSVATSRLADCSTQIGDRDD
jgi:hypothetical protein